MIDQFEYQIRVLRVFAAADIQDELLWHDTPDGIRFTADVSDVFFWGCADGEPIDPEDVDALEKAYADCVEARSSMSTAELYAARRRGVRPQGAAYPVESAAAQALMDACGPERPVGLGNPRRPPVPADRSGV